MSRRPSGRQITVWAVLARFTVQVDSHDGALPATSAVASTTAMQILGTVRDYQDLHAVLRQRAADLCVTREGIDEIVGLQSGYAAKLLSPDPIRYLGARTMGDFLEGMGVKLIAVVDEDAVARHAAKIERYRAAKVFQPAPPIPRDVRVAAEQLIRERAAKGARARNARLSPEERSRRASAAGKARWAKIPPKKRKAAMRLLRAKVPKKRGAV
jgi:hypothetical protein